MSKRSTANSKQSFWHHQRSTYTVGDSRVISGAAKVSREVIEILKKSEQVYSAVSLGNINQIDKT